MAKFSKIDRIEGKYVNLREVVVDDAEFLVKLRTSERAQFLHKTDTDIQKQIDYIKKYLTRDNECYFLVEDTDKKPIGTTRIIKIDDEVFETASTIMMPGSTPAQTLEMIMLSLNYAFNVLGFKKLYSYVDKNNKQVITFNKFLGLRIVREDDKYCYMEAFQENFKRLKKYNTNKKPI